MTCLRWERNERGYIECFTLENRRCIENKTYRILFKQFQRDLKFACHIRVQNLSYVRLLLEIERKTVVFQKRGLDGGARETSQSAHSRINGHVGGGNDLFAIQRKLSSVSCVDHLNIEISSRFQTNLRVPSPVLQTYRPPCRISPSTYARGPTQNRVSTAPWPGPSSLARPGRRFVVEEFVIRRLSSMLGWGYRARLRL